MYNAYSWETLWTFKTRNFTVKWQVTACDDLDLTWCETGETAEKIESGEWVAFDSRVIVYWQGREVGTDYLGQSIYADPQEFITGHRDPDPMNRNCSIMRETRGQVCIGHYFPGMVRTAIAEARAALSDRPYIRAA